MKQTRLLLLWAAALPPVGSLGPLTFATFIGLLACTGLRVIKARRLRPEDFDAEAGTLRVAAAKSSPERLLPLHSSAVRALLRYQSARHRRWPFAERFFVGVRGRPLSDGVLHATFRQLVHSLPGNGARARPRLYDFRHSFATRMIARWSRAGVSIAHHLVLLSRYLGHQSFLATYWYVSADAAAMRSVAAQFQRHWRAQPKVLHAEPHAVPVPPPAILRGTPPHPSPCESANHRRLPRYLPSAAALSLRPPALPG